MTTNRPAAQMHPYDGSRTIEHFGDRRDRPPSAHQARTYGTDKSGSVDYRFNALGFRGEDYRPEAAQRMFVFGPSTCFGTGLAEEATWPYQFKLLYAQHRILAPEEVNLLNFAHGGASNGSAVRMALTQCAQAPPNLAIVQFAPGHFRTEFFSREILDSDLHVSLGPWMLGDDARAKSRIRAEHAAVADAIEAYALYYSEETGVISSIKDLLLLQSWCENKGVEHLACWGCGPAGASDVTPWSNHPSIAPLLDLVDWNRVYPVELMDLHVDLAADGYHPGAEACRQFAAGLWDAYRTAYGRGA